MQPIGLESFNAILAIGGFHVTSYWANFASHRTRDRHVGFLFACDGIGKGNKMLHYFLFSSYHITKLQPSDKNIRTYTRMKFQNLPIYTRDTRFPIPPRVMASSAMGLNLGDSGFLPTIHAKANAKQIRSRSSRATRDCLHAQTAEYDYRKTWRPPNWAPLRWHRFWYLWCIFVGKSEVQSF